MQDKIRIILKGVLRNGFLKNFETPTFVRRLMIPHATSRSFQPLSSRKEPASTFACWIVRTGELIILSHLSHAKFSGLCLFLLDKRAYEDVKLKRMKKITRFLKNSPFLSTIPQQNSARLLCTFFSFCKLQLIKLIFNNNNFSICTIETRSKN